MTETSIIGCSSKHCELLERLSKVAPTDAEVLITGPSGVGKELYARYVHKCSQRNQGAFVPVNCGALAADLLENELFGHVSGAFTGARPNSDGLVAAAEGGTLFLDEVDTLAHICQVKLLRFLQDKEYRRLGETRVRRANIRIIAATNASLVTAMREGRFREDLFFRLRVFTVDVPRLRDRCEDIPLLLDEYITRFSEEYRLPKIKFSRTSLEKLASYGWPGNIRELENCINFLTCLQLGRPVEPADLPLLFDDTESLDNGSAPSSGEEERLMSEFIYKTNENGSEIRPYQEAKRDLVNSFSRSYLNETLRRNGGIINKAAKTGDMDRRVFFELMRKHGIRAGNYLDAA